MRASAPTRLTVRTESEVLDTVPSLLGFHPSDSVVVLLVTPEHGVLLTVRIDLTTALRLVDPTKPMAGALQRIGPRRDLGAVVVGYGSDIDALRTAVASMLWHLPAAEIFGAVVVGDRWWFHDDGPHDPGRPHDPRGSAIGAECAYSGQLVLGSRADLESMLDPSPGRRPAALTRAFAAARREVSQLTAADLTEAMHRTLGELADSVTSPAPVAQLARLSMLARHPEAREAYWRRLDTTTADGFVDLWVQVVRVTPKRALTPPLCLLGMAAWQAGEGALLSICFDRAAALAPRHHLVQVLASVCYNLLPPQLWDEMRSGPGAYLA